MYFIFYTGSYQSDYGSCKKEITWKLKNVLDNYTKQAALTNVMSLCKPSKDKYQK